MTTLHSAAQVRVSGPFNIYERHVEDRWLRFHFCPSCGSLVPGQASYLATVSVPAVVLELVTMPPVVALGEESEA